MATPAATAMDPPELLELTGDVAELVAALAEAQGEFPPIEKGKTATVQGKDGKQGYSYRYADIADVLAAVRPVLSKHGLAILQRTKPRNGKTMLLTELRHQSGQMIDSEVELTAAPTNPQQFGGMLTYLRRYEVVTLLGIAAEEDTDAQHVEPPPRNGNGRHTGPAYGEPAGEDAAAKAHEALRMLLEVPADSAEDDVQAPPEYASAVLAAVHRDAGGYLPRIAVRALLHAGATLKSRLEPPAAAGPDEDPPPDPADPDPAGALETEADLDAAAAAGSLEPDPEPERPAPGTVDKPELEEGETESDLRERYQAAGCTCSDPLAPDDDKAAHKDDCPIKGHGIPF